MRLVTVRTNIDRLARDARADTTVEVPIPPAASAGHARRRFPRQTRIGNRRDLQNAIVIATVLGPCRPFKSHDVQ